MFGVYPYMLQPARENASQQLNNYCVSLFELQPTDFCSGSSQVKFKSMDCHTRHIYWALCIWDNHFVELQVVVTSGYIVHHTTTEISF